MRKRFPSVRVGGVRVDALDVRRLHQHIARVVRSGRTELVLNANAQAIVLAHDDPEFAEVLEQAPVVFCDGSGVRLGACLSGGRLPARITYADWIHQLCPFLRDEGFSLYLLGSRPGVAEQAAERLTALYPGLRIAGTGHGYFAKEGPENDAVLDRIRAAQPDILLLGFGMPLQEKWAHRHRGRLEARVILSGGACIDYAAGTVRRGPKWLVDHHMEWFARLWVEPRRLWRRYLIGLPRFLWLSLAGRAPR